MVLEGYLMQAGGEVAVSGRIHRFGLTFIVLATISFDNLLSV